MKQTQKQRFIEAFRKGTQEHTGLTWVWDSKLGHSVEAPFPYPIPAGKFTIDEKFGRNVIAIRSRRCWSDDLQIVAKKVAANFNAKVSDIFSMRGFGTAYDVFMITLL